MLSSTKVDTGQPCLRRGWGGGEGGDPCSPGPPCAKPEHLVSIMLCTGEGQRLGHWRRVRATVVQAQLHKAQVLRLSSSPRKTFEEDTSSSDSSCGAAWQVQKPLRPFASINQWIKPAIALTAGMWISQLDAAKMSGKRAFCPFKSKMTSVFLEALEKKSRLLASASPALAIDSLEMFHIGPNWLLTE